LPQSQPENDDKNSAISLPRLQEMRRGSRPKCNCQFGYWITVGRHRLTPSRLQTVVRSTTLSLRGGSVQTVRFVFWGAVNCHGLRPRDARPIIYSTLFCKNPELFMVVLEGMNYFLLVVDG
jgi:hypothetical protein